MVYKNIKHVETNFKIYKSQNKVQKKVKLHDPGQAPLNYNTSSIYSKGHKLYDYDYDYDCFKSTIQS